LPAVSRIFPGAALISSVELPGDSVAESLQPDKEWREGIEELMKRSNGHLATECVGSYLSLSAIRAERSRRKKRQSDGLDCVGANTPVAFFPAWSRETCRGRRIKAGTMACRQWAVVSGHGFVVFLAEAESGRPFRERDEVRIVSSPHPTRCEAWGDTFHQRV